ncbi:MAG: dTDP-4-dehydrorhamnose reductase [Candidatus Andersenbacteria bacterium]|nr:dTDP-4-dehydrorhamnose reductase [Candidatus Andersenbacteria bacterium]MBI3251090.1 dTDP-4-dehydrorhamnose reductase [Candidatus Andersenbacteria bacterium]
MKTLIIGAKGMLGSMLAQVFSDWKPTAWDRAEVDITDLHDVREKLRALAPKVIINAAAYTDVDGAETQQELAFAVNEGGVRNLAIVAKEIDATLIHYSTDYVFDGQKKEGYSENDSPGPAVNVYGQSKLAGERALVEIKPKFYLQRSAWLYGPGGKNFVDTMLEMGKTNDNVTVVADQYGSPTFTKDLALATRALVSEKYPFGIYHSVNVGTASWFDFANKIFQIKHMQVDAKPVNSTAFPRPARRPQWSVLLNENGPAMRPWEKALEEYLGPSEE